jgi:hypothetical protein
MIKYIDINNQVSIIQRQTNYSETEAREKLVLFNMDHIKVIKNYLNIPDKKEAPIISIQQEMYKQMRIKLDDSIKEFNLKQDKKLESEIEKNNM